MLNGLVYLIKVLTVTVCKIANVTNRMLQNGAGAAIFLDQSQSCENTHFSWHSLVITKLMHKVGLQTILELYIKVICDGRGADPAGQRHRYTGAGAVDCGADRVIRLHQCGRSEPYSVWIRLGPRGRRLNGPRLSAGTEARATPRQGAASGRLSLTRATRRLGAGWRLTWAAGRPRSSAAPASRRLRSWPARKGGRRPPWRLRSTTGPETWTLPAARPTAARPICPWTRTAGTAGWQTWPLGRRDTAAPQACPAAAPDSSPGSATWPTGGERRTAAT